MLRCSQRWWNVYQGGNMWAGYDCYSTASRDILGLKLESHDKYEAWEECVVHGGFRVLHEDFCMVSDFPEILLKDEQNRPHCENGPSHKWRDGWSLYHWHGVSIPEAWIMDKKTLTAKDALNWENLEQRRAACEILGWAAIVKELNFKTINEDKNPQIGKLIEVDLPDSGKDRFLMVQCGTKREFVLSVPPTSVEKGIKTALNAWNWLHFYDLNRPYGIEVRT